MSFLQEQRIESAMKESQEFEQNKMMAQLLLILKLLKKAFKTSSADNQLTVETEEEKDNQLTVETEEEKDNQLTAETESSLRITQDGKEVLLARLKGEQVLVEVLDEEALAQIDLNTYLTPEGVIDRDLTIELNDETLIEAKDGQIQQNALSGLSESQANELLQRLYHLEAEKVYEANNGDPNPSRQSQLEAASFSVLGQLEVVVTSLEKASVLELEEGSFSSQAFEETRSEMRAFFPGKLKSMEAEEAHDLADSPEPEPSDLER